LRSRLILIPIPPFPVECLLLRSSETQCRMPADLPYFPHSVEPADNPPSASILLLSSINAPRIELTFFFSVTPVLDFCVPPLVISLVSPSPSLLAWPGRGLLICRDPVEAGTAFLSVLSFQPFFNYAPAPAATIPPLYSSPTPILLLDFFSPSSIVDLLSPQSSILRCGVEIDLSPVKRISSSLSAPSPQWSPWRPG